MPREREVQGQGATTENSQSPKHEQSQDAHYRPEASCSRQAGTQAAGVENQEA